MVLLGGGMRDLERLQDVVEYRVSPGQLRLVFLGVLAVACAIFAVGVSIGKRIEPGSSALVVDPLAALDRATGGAAPEPEGAAPEETPQLTYHDELTQRVAPGHDQIGDGERGVDAAEPSTTGSETARRGSASNARPASAAPTSSERLQVEPAELDQPEPGEDAIFTLQVASFDTREEAQDFTTDLRSRGHPVFLVRTSTPERGTWYRVRVGPFRTRRDAMQYQTRFERQERLPTFLVQRRAGASR
jgi:cell division septation protein DedD